MFKVSGAVAVLVLTAALAACVPTTNIKDPLTARPQTTRINAAPANGAIYQSGINDRPMFEDRRARHIGDVLTITIVETTSASGKSGTTLGNTGTLAVTSPAITGGLSGSSTVKSSNSSDASGTNTFSGTLTATVIDVLANGNLRVSGEKQVTIRHSNEYVRFSGVVSPVDISAANSVPSTKVADVHLEYKGATNLDASDVTSMFARIFTTLLPF